MWQTVWSTVALEFTDVSDIETITQISLRLVVAAILGGIIGYERELKSRDAGLRTHILVCMGTAIFVIGPTQAGMPIEDMSRVLQGIIQGMGFLGAGAIVVGTIKQRTQGLTTAAGVWATAGIGVAVGLGLEATAVLATLFVVTTLGVLPLLRNPDRELGADTDEKK